MKLNLQLSTTLALTLGALIVAAPGKAQTISVTDNGHNTLATKIPHTQNFSTTLSATVSGTPTPHQECQITSGPSWSWYNSAGSLSGNLTSSSVTLTQNAFLTAGNHSITVTAVAHWLDNCGNSYTVPGVVNVSFFALIPTKAYAALAASSKIPGPPYWGHTATYAMLIIDNSATPTLYTYGEPGEELSGTQLNPTYAFDLQHGSPQAPGIGTRLDFPTGQWQDDNDWNNQGWTNPTPLDTGDTTLWFQFNQTIHCYETGPGYPNYTYNNTLNTFIVYHQQGQTLRSANP